MLLMNGERGCRLELFMRECFERNGSAQDGSRPSCKRAAYPYLRGTVPYRTVPKSRVNAALGFKGKDTLTQEVAVRVRVRVLSYTGVNSYSCSHSHWI